LAVVTSWTLSRPAGAAGAEVGVAAWPPPSDRRPEVQPAASRTAASRTAGQIRGRLGLLRAATITGSGRCLRCAG
jgi:hypothetical protein